MKPEQSKQRLTALLSIGLALLYLFVPFVNAGGLLSYEEPGQVAQVNALLYFPYENSQWLAPEARELSVLPTQSLEQALVQALLDGPQQTSLGKVRLFPEGTQVLSVLSEGSRLFVTFNDQIMKPLPGEEGNQEALLTKARHRRQLAMAALVNTLTESGLYHSVQVLVVDQNTRDNSLRLSSRYYLEDTEELPPPLTRQEQALLTPGKAAEYSLLAWRNQDWARFVARLALSPGQSGQRLQALTFDQLPALVSFSCSSGIPAPDGSYAIVSLDASLLMKDGTELSYAAFPLKMLRQGPGWLISLPSLLSLTGEGSP